MIGRLRITWWATSSAAMLLLAPGLVPLQPPSAAAAQSVFRISQRATISQKLGSTLVSLDYSRPLARGRSDLFGKVVTWGELWTPGANEATVLELSDTVKLNGRQVLPGRWTMWIIPSRVGPWELVLDPRDSLFHTQRPELKDDQVRLVVEARHDAPHVEALTWSFPRIAQDGGTLQLNWGRTQIPLEVEVESVQPVLTVAAEEAARYTGAWRLTFEPDPSTGKGLPPAVLTIRTGSDGSLIAAFPPGVFTPPQPDAPDPAKLAQLPPQERERLEAKLHLSKIEGGAFEYLLVPRAQGVFLMGWQQDGVLLDVEELYHEFDLEGGRAVRLTVRDHEDEVKGRGTRERE